MTFEQRYNCLGCCFFRRFPTPAGKSDGFISGQCRHRSPVLDLRGSDGPKTMWPRVRGTDFCGEHATFEERADG